ncbi:MAG: DegT/DnrJ/EryC1/StrS family aminotransferase [Magnetococcales bacterium]|nr:DegT/DnrJ/EryC1/StrS family aminotransferase [Magnetococcales bacterium]
MIPIIRPALDETEVAAAARVLNSGWITQGPEVAAFETEFAALVGAPAACAVSSCTAALHLALLAVGVRPGDEVITVSHSFIATANAVRHCQATPVFVDILPDTYCMDPGQLEMALSPRTRAILCVHQIGLPCDLNAILAFARPRGIAVVEDAACAVGSEILLEGAWGKIGGRGGDMACFSFHPRKILTTGDGGMITCQDPQQAARLKRLRQHGMGVPDTIRHHASEVIFESYDEPGFNYRLTDLQAAIGREQLKKLPYILERRRQLAQNYRRLLSAIPGATPPGEPPWAHSNFQSYCVRLPPGTDQKKVMQSLLDHGISSRRGVMCAHLEPACADLPRRLPLPQSERARDETILLPLYHELEPSTQERIIEILRAACTRQ